MSRTLGRILTGFTCFLIAFIAYSSQISVFYPWYGYTISVDFLWAMIPFNVLIALIWYNYYLVVFTSPGRIPNGWQPQTGEGQSFEVKQGSGKLRYCRSCKAWKPPRSHHCRECNACTLRMDHHCPWVNNCVGHYNYASFIRFLFFVDVACLYHATLFVRMVWDVVESRYMLYYPTTSQVVWAVLNFAACGPVLVAVGLFSLYHFYLLATNTTTIEAWEKDKVAMLVRRGRIEKIKFPYNLGMLKNINYVLGGNPLFWCLPTRQVEGDGLSYPVEAGTEEHIQYIWPPKEPSNYYEPRPMPDTPWTYGSGVNPHLEPSNARMRAQAASAPRERNNTEVVANKGRSRKKMDSFTAFLKSLDNEQPNSDLTPSPASSDVDSDADYLEQDGEDRDGDGDGARRTRRVGGGRQQMREEDEDSDAYDTRIGRPKARRGSEGWEVKPLTAWAREEIVRKYAARRGLAEDHDALLRPAGVPAHEPPEQADTKRKEHVLIPPDKYNRYVPSAVESSSSDEGEGEEDALVRLDPLGEARSGDRLWEAHIDAWEGRVNVPAAVAATEGVGDGSSP